MTSKEFFLERLHNLLCYNKISANKMTKELKISTASVTEWSKGKASPSISTLAKIADYFNVSTDYLLGREQMTLASKKITTPNRVYLNAKHIIDIIKSETKPDKLTAQYAEHGVDACQLTREDYQLILEKGGNMTLNELIYLSDTCDIYLPDIFIQLSEDELLNNIPAAAKGGAAHFED